MTRRASAVWPRWVKILPRIRARSPQENAKSTSSCSSKTRSCSGVSNGLAISSMSSPVRISVPSIGWSFPSTRIRGPEPPESRRSDPPRSHRVWSQGSILGDCVSATPSLPFNEANFSKCPALRPGTSRNSAKTKSGYTELQELGPTYELAPPRTDSDCVRKDVVPCRQARTCSARCCWATTGRTDHRRSFR